MIKRVASSRFPTEYGDFELYGFLGPKNEELVVLTKGDVSGDNVLFRLHSACLTGDVFHSKRCDCRTQLEESMKRIANEGRGIIVYVYGHEGRGIGILNKIKAYELQDSGMDTVEANRKLGFEEDLRNYGFVPELLEYFGVRSVRLLTNNPKKINGLNGRIKVERVPLFVTPTKTNRGYLRTKKSKMGHLLSENV